jgi:hypothetical protein
MPIFRLLSVDGAIPEVPLLDADENGSVATPGDADEDEVRDDKRKESWVCLLQLGMQNCMH